MVRPSKPSRQILSSLLALSAVASISGFSPQTMTGRMPFGRIGQDAVTVTKRSRMASLFSVNNSKVSTSDMTEYFADAIDCAHSDSCPVEEAESYFSRIQEIRHEKESLASICDDILSELRFKLEAVRSSSKLHISESGAAVARVYTPIEMVADAMIVTLVMIALAWMYPIVAHNDNHYTTISIREWALAYKHGYLDDMIFHYMRNGGL